MKTVEVRRGPWKVLALSSERGDCPLLRFLAKLEGNLARDGRRMLALLDRVAQHGPRRNRQEDEQNLTRALFARRRAAK